MTLYYLDEVGFGLSLPTTYTWSKRGSKNRMRVPSRWGSSGRLNLIEALSWSDKRLHFELLEGSVTSERVIAFVTALTKDAKAGQVTVVVLDNAGFHVSKLVQAARQVWEERDVYLRHLPPYSPHLNPIEALWKRLKAFLLPRRFYPSVAELRRAVLEVLALLAAVQIDSSLGGA